MNYKAIIESAGAEFIGKHQNVVYFGDPETGAILSLYIFACRSREDVELALKCRREIVKDFPPLEPTEVAQK